MITKLTSLNTTLANMEGSLQILLNTTITTSELPSAGHTTASPTTPGLTTQIDITAGKTNKYYTIYCNYK
jgi:hypothetical protein